MVKTHGFPVDFPQQTNPVSIVFLYFQVFTLW